MKQTLPIVALLCAIVCGCNRIPQQSIIQPLTGRQLAAAVAGDSAFSTFYAFVRTRVDSLDTRGIERYRPITYRRLHDYLQFVDDSSVWTPLAEQYRAAWDALYGTYATRADSVIDYWRAYRQVHSPSRYIRISLVKLTNEGDWGFKLTPLHGRVEQLQFKYRYVKKGDDSPQGAAAYPGFFGWQLCVQPTSFASTVVRYWHAATDEEHNLMAQYTDAEHFLRHYNMYAEPTSITVGGRTLSADDSGLPLSVEMCLNYGTQNDSLMWGYYKSHLISDLLCDHYVTEPDFTTLKTDSVKRQRDPLCFDFVERLAGSSPAGEAMSGRMARDKG